MTNRLLFDQIEHLAAWLVKSGIDARSWGEGESKQLIDLWQEYVSGESSFTDNPPTRLIRVAVVLFRRGDKMLLELAQEFAGGRRRARLQPPSEKLKGGEDPQAAAWRCLREELGLREAQVTLSETGQTIEEEIDSPSYPGLPTHYLFNIFEAMTDSLPDDDFYRENDAPEDPIRRHLWGWRQR